MLTFRLKQKLFISIGILIILLLVSACSSGAPTGSEPQPSETPSPATTEPQPAEPAPKQDKPLTKLPMGLVGGKVVDDLPIYIAQEKGFFAEEGIEIEIIYHGTMPDARDAFVGGDTDVSILSLNFLAVLKEKGVESRFVSVFTSTVPWGLVATKESGIKSVEDLQGKSIHVGNPGTLAYSMARAVLEEAGMDPEDAVYAGGSLGSQVPALASGQVDAAVLLDPALSQVLLQGIGDIVYPFNEMMKGYSTAHLAMKQEFIDNNKELANSFQRALNKAMTFIHSNKEETYSLAQQIYDDMPADVFEMAFERYYPVFKTDVYYSEQNYQDERNLVLKFGMIEAIPFNHDEVAYIGE